MSGILALVATLASTVCGGSSSPASSPPSAPPPAAAPASGIDPVGDRGQAFESWPDLTIAIVDARRDGKGMMRFTFVVENRSPAGEAFAFDGRFAAADEDRGSIADVYAEDPTGRRKYYIVRDDQQRPLCTRDLVPLPAGERRELWAVFPAPPDDTDAVTIHFPGGLSLEGRLAGPAASAGSAQG